MKKVDHNPEMVKNAIVNSDKNKLENVSTEEGLAFFINQNLTVDQYRAIRNLTSAHGAPIMPSYEAILAEKKTKLDQTQKTLA